MGLHRRTVDRLEIGFPDNRFGPVPQGAQLTFGVRPEHISIGGEAAVSLGDARVHLVEHLGGTTVVYAVTPGGSDLTVVVPGQVSAKIGDVVPLRTDIGYCHIFTPDGNVLVA